MVKVNLYDFCYLSIYKYFKIKNTYNNFSNNMSKSENFKSCMSVELERLRGSYVFKKLAKTTQNLYLNLLSKYFIWLKDYKKTTP